MSKNDGSTFSKLSRFFSNSSQNSVSNDTNDELSSVPTNQEIAKDVYIPLCNSTSDYSPATKRPYSSVKQLNLSPQFSPKCDQDLLINNFSTNKRLKVGEENGSSSLNLSSYGGVNHFASLQRPSSRLSLSTTSSTSTTPGFRSLKYFSGRLSSASEQTKTTKDLNSSLASDSEKPNSYFYLGKTTFGGANLHKRVRRLSATPYSTLAVRSIEAKASNHNSSRSLNDDVRLGSITQRILERLEKAATPIQDAKRRPVSNNTQTQPPSRIFDKSCKLFDTSSPAVESQGRCKIDLSYKPIKYVLKPVGESGNGATSSSLVDKDIEKLNEIREAERELENQSNLGSDKPNFQPRKDLTLGKLTSRDVKKGRRIDDLPIDEENEHLQSLSNVKPLSAPALKPFVLRTTIEKADSNDETCDEEKKSFSGDKSDSVQKIAFHFPSPTTVAEAKSAPKATLSAFSFSSPKIATDVPDATWDEKFKLKGKDWSLLSTSNDSNLDSSKIGDVTSTNAIPSISLNDMFKKKKSTWSCPTCSVDNEESDDKCVSCEEPNPNKKVSQVATLEAAKVDVKFGNLDSSMTLKDIFKKNVGKSWTCPICSVSNDNEEPKCVSCEEPNPNLPAKQEKVKLPEIKFGAFASTKLPDPVKTPSNEIPKSSSEADWSCFYCKSLNSDASQNVCKSCNKIKVVAATKDQVQKFYDSQSFKFGFNKPVSVASKTSTDAPPPTTASFNFGVPKLATDVPKSSPFTVDSVSTINKNIDKIGGDFSKPVDSPVSKVDLKSSSQFKFGATTNASDSTSLNFGSKVFPASTPLESGTTSTFSFGSKNTPDNSVLKLKTSSEIEKNSTLTNSEKTVPSFSFGKSHSSASAAPVTTTAGTSNSLFVFGAKSTESDKKPVESNALKLPTFAPSTSAINTGIDAVSSSKTTDNNESTGGMFTFNASKNASTGTPLSTSNSTTAFAFSAAPKASIGASGNTLIAKSDIDFGSPIQIPKINAGPPIQVNPMTINFGSSNPSTSTKGSLFTTSTQNVNSVPLFGSNQSGDKPGFNFAAATSNPPVFGSTTIPTSFNFNSNNNSSAQNTNTLFTFGAKPNSQPSSSQGSVPFNATPSEQPSFACNNFASSNLSQPSFGTGLFGANAAPQGQQPTQTLVVPTLGLSTFQNPAPSNNIFVPNLNFQTDPSTNVFQFSAEQPQFGMGERKIKKARRRLK